MNALFAILVATLVLGGCETTTPPTQMTASPEPSGTFPTPTPAGLTIEDAAACPRTKGVQAPDEFRDRLAGGSSAFGNDGLWVGGLGRDGVIVADQPMVEEDGSIGWKFGWWRLVAGTVTIEGRRLDDSAPPLRPSVPDGYGLQGFQASGVFFPTEGCWEVTGRVGESELTFVTFVLRGELVGGEGLRPPTSSV
jgi:hypothetical protein